MRSALSVRRKIRRGLNPKTVLALITILIMASDILNQTGHGPEGEIVMTAAHLNSDWNKGFGDDQEQCD